MIVPTTAAALCERLDAALARLGEPCLLAFDADGTLWRGDVTRDLVAFVMAERLLLPEALPGLQALAAAHGVLVANEVHDQLAALVLSYSAGRLADAPAVESVLLSFSGHAEADFVEFVDEAVERAGLRARFRPTVLPVFEWAARRSVRTVVVSASPRAAVERALFAVGLRASAVLGAEPRAVGGTLSPSLASPVLVGAAKVEALREHTEDVVLAAFGDDARDAALLGAGRFAVAVHPTDELLRSAADFDALHVLSDER